MTHWRFVLGEPEVDLDRRQRDVHDRDVEDDHELDCAQERESQPLPPVGDTIIVPFIFVVILATVTSVYFQIASTFFQIVTEW